MNEVVKILMERDGNIKEEAESRLAESRQLCYDILAEGSYENVEDTVACELGLEMDYIFDILD